MVWSCERIIISTYEIERNVFKAKGAQIVVQFCWIGFCICIFTTVCVLFFSHFFRSLSPLPQQTQIGLAMVAVSTLVISGIVSYTALCVTAWGYGLALGCYRYTLKMLALERVRAKHFTKAWGKYKYTQYKYTSTICPMLSFSSWFTFP